MGNKHDGCLPDASASLENVEILENVRDCHQTQGSQEPKAWGGRQSLHQSVTLAVICQSCDAGCINWIPVFPQHGIKLYWEGVRKTICDSVILFNPLVIGFTI